jgi:hypothetical protein
MLDRELMRDGRWLVRRLGRARRLAGPRGATGRSGVDALVLAPSATPATSGRQNDGRPCDRGARDPGGVTGWTAERSLE